MYLHPHVCLACRKSFKRKADAPSLGESGKMCPDCGTEMILLSRHFKAPAKDDAAQWTKVKYLVENGYYFERVGSSRENWPKPPENLAEAREFIELYVSKTREEPEARPEKRSEGSIREEKDKRARIRLHQKSARKAKD